MNPVASSDPQSTIAFSAEPYRTQIVARLKRELARLSDEFQTNGKLATTRFVAIDELLPAETAMRIAEAFPKQKTSWREMKSFRERKLTSKNFHQMPKILGDITFTIQHPDVIRLVEQITGIKDQHADPTLYAGGLSMMRKGDFLNPHIDNSHNHDRSLYRRINLLYYVTPDWHLDDGGHLELWDRKVRKPIVIESRFNRLVLMETHNLSWHSVSPVTRDGGYRRCVSNYYFSPNSPLDHDYFHVTSFKGRPEQPLRRLLSDIDSVARSFARKLKSGGFGKEDLYGKHSNPDLRAKRPDDRA